MTSQNVGLADFIGSLEYPIYKYQIMHEASRWGVSSDERSELDRLPDRLYENAAQIGRALGSKEE